MLKVTGTTTTATGAKMTVGRGPLLEYYPYDQRIPIRCHWRFGDFRHTLLDLSISDLDGAIVGVTLTSFGGETKTGAPAAIVKADCAVGLPIVSGVAVGATIVDERRDVSMHFQGEHVYILLSTDIVKPGCVGADRLRFFVEGDQLVAVGFGPLAKEEHDELVRLLAPPL